MKFAAKKIKNFFEHNLTFVRLSMIYIVFLLLASSLACYFAYRQRQEELNALTDVSMSQYIQWYHDTVTGFSQIYMPIFESERTFYNILDHYFEETDSELSLTEKGELTKVLSQMMLRDDQVRWIALFSEQRDVNYILFSGSSSIKELPDDFPYADDLKNKSMQMEVYGMHTLEDNGAAMDTFAICGGTPWNHTFGSILAGYNISALNQIFANNPSPIKSTNYYLVSDGELIFTSDKNYDASQKIIPADAFTGTMKNDQGHRVFVDARKSGHYTDMIISTASWGEVFLYSHTFTPWLLLITLIFGFLSIYVYTIMLKSINKEVNVIRYGLSQIGENHFEYRITTELSQNGFSDIAQSINHMAGQLEEYINRAYYYELRKREAELSELQSKFNPHFLYNSLEMLCGRCYQNGDEETAGLITQLAAIFRGFIGSSTFVPLKEELAFSENYLALFGARYENQLEILYDIETGLLQYGIIRNIFQPLIENYFQHGFDSSITNNYILFKGYSIDDKTMVFSVEDNGIGISNDEIDRLNAHFHEPVQASSESYGLKNLHQRLAMFYGGDCGLAIKHNHPKGIVIEMTMRKMTCEEYLESRQKNGNHEP